MGHWSSYWCYQAEKKGLTPELLFSHFQVMDKDQLATSCNFDWLQALCVPSAYPQHILNNIFIQLGAAHTLWNISQAIFKLHLGDWKTSKKMCGVSLYCMESCCKWPYQRGLFTDYQSHGYCAWDHYTVLFEVECYHLIVYKQMKNMFFCSWESHGIQTYWPAGGQKSINCTPHHSNQWIQQNCSWYMLFLILCGAILQGCCTTFESQSKQHTITASQFLNCHCQLSHESSVYWFSSTCLQIMGSNEPLDKNSPEWLGVLELDGTHNHQDSPNNNCQPPQAFTPIFVLRPWGKIFRRRFLWS